MKKILLDTNFLLIPYQFKVDIFSEIKRIAGFKYRFFIIDNTINELEKILLEQKGKNRHAAVLALAFLSRMDFSRINTKGRKNEGKSVDELILEESAKSKDWIVATQDAELKRKLKSQGTSLIVLKGKSHLALLES